MVYGQSYGSFGPQRLRVQGLQLPLCPETCLRSVLEPYPGPSVASSEDEDEDQYGSRRYFQKARRLGRVAEGWVVVRDENDVASEDVQKIVKVRAEATTE